MLGKFDADGDQKEGDENENRVVSQFSVAKLDVE